jgi:MraZ protein
MYLGRYSYNLDDKGRLAIPAKLRSGGEEEDWVLAQGLDHCLFLYPKGEWGEVSARIQALAANRSAARRFARILFAGAVEVSLDRQGRVNIPAHLRQWAALEREAVGRAGRITPPPPIMRRPRRNWPIWSFRDWCRQQPSAPR